MLSNRGGTTTKRTFPEKRSIIFATRKSLVYDEFAALSCYGLRPRSINRLVKHSLRTTSPESALSFDIVETSGDGALRTTLAEICDAGTGWNSRSMFEIRNPNGDLS